LSVLTFSKLAAVAQQKHRMGVKPHDVYIMHLRYNLKILVCIALGIALGAKVDATMPQASSDRYQIISERNAFGLRPPAEPLAVNSSPVPLPKITLTGITTILGDKRALMIVAPVGSRPGDPNKELSLIMTEGQREGEIEVLQIDEKAWSVKVKNSGTVLLLTFEKDEAKLPASSPALPGQPLVPGSLLPNPYTPFMRGGPLGLPGRSARSPATPAGQSVSPAQTQLAAPESLTPEAQAIMIELQRQASANNTSFPPLPPTPLTPTDTGSRQGSP
jgi:hypothetical protein